MDSLVNWLNDIASWVIPPKPVGIIDIIQILILSFFVYKIIFWMKNTRSYTLLKGILIVLAFIIIANVFKMDVIIWLIQNLGVVAIVALVIIFQPELRKILEKMGQSNFLTSALRAGKASPEDKRYSDNTINEIVRASFEMGEMRTGALIVFEKMIILQEYINTGIPIDGVISSQLLLNIFEHNTPLHDGAVIVRGDRIMAATCYLPLSDNMGLSKKYGTRHRAAIGISEVSDSLTIVVSEETGSVSYAMNGHLRSAVTPSELRELLIREQTAAQRQTIHRDRGRAV
ncbi:MAG: TIGR00159 family protein [Eubacterium sp.]|nr:TIGR00159 family protein [Eubacterium sp.]